MNNQQSANFSLPDATAILKQAWSIYKQRLSIFLGIMAIPMLIIVLFSFLSSKFAGAGLGLTLLIVILFLMIIFVSQIWGQTALIYAIKDSQENIGVIESYRRGWRKIISYWWVSLLVGFITLGGSLLLIVPGIIFGVWFSLAGYVLIAEDLKGINALLKSKEYVKGKWGGVFWRSLFIGLFSLIFYFPGLILSLLKIPLGEEISGFATGLFLTPLVMTYSFLLYSHLKSLKGEFVFMPTKGKKAAFIFAGILGLLVIPALFTIVLLGLGRAKEKARDAQIIVGIGQIRSAAEIYYEGNNNSYIGFQDDSQIKTVIEDIKNNGGEIRFGQINEESYVVWSPLISSPNQFYCADSGGFACMLTGEPPGGEGGAVKCGCPE